MRGRGWTGPEAVPLPVLWADDVEAWARYMLTAGRPQTTIDLRVYQLTRLGVDHAGIRPWELTSAQLIDWLAGKPWRSETRRSWRTTLRGFYRWGLESGRTDIDPTSALPAVVSTPGVPRPAADDRIRFALAGADARVRLMIMLAAMLGLRRVEIARVHTDDLGVGGLRVLGKGGRVRLIPMPEVVRQAMVGLPRGPVFPNPSSGRAMTAAHVGKLMSRQLGPGVTAHMLRHRFASTAYAAERDIRAVQQLLGHSNVTTTQVYTAVPADALSTAVNAAALLGRGA